MVRGSLLLEELSAKILGIITDSSLAFDIQVKKICKKVSEILTGISRISNFLSESERKIFIQTFFESRFNICL